LFIVGFDNKTSFVRYYITFRTNKSIIYIVETYTIYHFKGTHYLLCVYM